MNWYLKVLREYFNFDGRARRKEYWMFILFNIIISWGLQGLSYALGSSGLYFLALIYGLLVMIPGLAVTVRRLHDAGYSGWYVLVLLIPIIGAIWLIVLTCLDSEDGVNKWGENPKGIGNDSTINQIGRE